MAVPIETRPSRRPGGNRRTVLVTGASSGIGRATAMRFSDAGWKVFAGVLNQAEADELSDVRRGRLEPILLDVTDANAILVAAERIGSEADGLDALVNNAGIAIPGPLETMPIAYFRRQIEVNLIGQVAVTQAMLPSLRVAKGRIVFVGSYGGRVTYALIGAYSAAKHGIESVGDAFRQELRPAGIAVSIIEPGTIATPMYATSGSAAAEINEASPETERLYGDLMRKYRARLAETAASGDGVSPEKVVDSIEHALTARRPRGRYMPGIGLDGKAEIWLKTIMPTSLFDRKISR